MELNVEPYTKEVSLSPLVVLNLVQGVARQEGEPPEDLGETVQKTPEDYQYELVGVVVHSGSMDSGHYYSYIKGSFFLYEISTF